LETSEKFVLYLSGLENCNGESASIYRSNSKERCFATGNVVGSGKISVDAYSRTLTAPNTPGKYFYCAKIKDLTADATLTVSASQKGGYECSDYRDCSSCVRKGVLGTEPTGCFWCEGGDVYTDGKIDGKCAPIDYAVSLTSTCSGTWLQKCPKETKNKESRMLDSILPDTPGVVVIDPEKAEILKVDKVKIKVKETVDNIEITIEDSSLPEDAELPVSTEIGETYKYLDITTNIGSEIIDSAEIKFKVEKSWVSENNIDAISIILNRYEDYEWTKLTTKRVICENDEDIANYYCFISKSPGFSTFAITGQIKTQTKVECPNECCIDEIDYADRQCDTGYECMDNSCVAVASEEIKTDQGIEDQDTVTTTPSGNSGTFILFGGLIAIAMLAVIYFVLKKRQKPKKSFDELYLKYGKRRRER
jgi:PGF-pre-PGF domain-containing protein